MRPEESIGSGGTNAPTVNSCMPLPAAKQRQPSEAGVAHPSDVGRDADATMRTTLLDVMFRKMALTSQRLLA